MMISCYIIAFAILSIQSLQCLATKQYKSTEDFFRWSKELGNQISQLADEFIDMQEENLIKLREMRNTIFSNNEYQQYRYNDEEENFLHPVKIFTQMNKLVKKIDTLSTFIDDNLASSNLLEEKIDKLDREYSLPTSENLAEVGLSVIRLQAFYDINAANMTKLSKNSQIDYQTTINYHLQVEESFELGRLAYENEEYSISMQWLQVALETLEDEDPDNDRYTLLLRDILDYMAFAAYKLGQTEISARLTRLWLENDPSNERAIQNLKYYEEKLAKNDSAITSQINESVNKSYYVRDTFEVDRYKLSDDDVVRRLCKTLQVSSLETKSSLCFNRFVIGKFGFYPDLKIEHLHTDPSIIRVYDIISDKEAELLRDLAKTRLDQSRVHSRSGVVTSNFRIAKTAWLSRDINSLLVDIEQRLTDIFLLDMGKSEDLQVVNYGLGGYYGPHLDSFRESLNKNNLNDEKQKQKDDRMATILVYLNHVEQGGATVFPLLNLTVEPLSKSAVFWYNIKRSGKPDLKTLHAGCPVLLGSKWIATKWPRENDNTFKRPCGLNRLD